MFEKPSAIALCILALVFTVRMPASAQAIYLPSFYTAGFGDGLHIDKHKTGYYRTYHDNDNYDGLEYSKNRFSQSGWASHGDQVAYAARTRDAEGNTTNWAIGHNTLDTRRSLWTIDGHVARKLGDTTTGELTFNRDRVEVRQSLVKHVVADSYNISLEQKIAAPLRTQLTLGETRYTDGNHRPTVKIKATYDVLPEYGMNLQLRSRYFKNTDTTVTSGYYNPYRFVENIAAAEINRTVNGWNLSGNLGWGRQAGGNDPKTLARAYEVSATTPIANRVFFRAKAGYFRSLGYNAPDFLFRYASEELIVVF
jgi:hypothetical protein